MDKLADAYEAGMVAKFAELGIDKQAGIADLIRRLAGGGDDITRVLTKLTKGLRRGDVASDALNPRVSSLLEEGMELSGGRAGLGEEMQKMRSRPPRGKLDLNDLWSRFGNRTHRTDMGHRVANPNARPLRRMATEARQLAGAGDQMDDIAKLKGGFKLDPRALGDTLS